MRPMEIARPVNVTESRILAKLGEGSSTNGALSHALDLPESTISGALRRLVDRGAVTTVRGIGPRGSTRLTYFLK